MKINSVADLKNIKAVYNEEMKKYKHQVLVCAGAGCVSSNCYAVRDAVVEELAALGLNDEVKMYETGCMGTCAVGPVMLIMPEKIFYTDLTPEIAKKVLKAHLVDGKSIRRTYVL